jgi:hypothetical protein
LSSYFNIDVRLSGTKQVCIGDSIFISSNIPERFSNPDYFWTGPNGFTSKERYIIIPGADSSDAGMYKLTVMNDGLCGWDTISIAVGVGDVKIKGQTEFCSGDSSILKTEPQSYKYYYLWNTGDTTSSVIVKKGGTYSVKVSNAAGCIDYDTLYVIEYPKPQLFILADTVICAGQASLLTTENEAEPGKDFSSYLWSTGDTTKELQIIHYESGIKKYWVIVENKSGCRDTAYIDINVVPAPSVSILGDTIICAGQSSLLATENVSEPGKDFSSYLWSTGDTTKEITITKSGTYYVEVTDSNGCQGYDTINVRAIKINLDFAGFNNWDAGKIDANTEKTKPLEIQNNSVDDAIVSIRLLNGTAFSLVGQTSPSVHPIPAGDALSLDISFRPASSGIFEDSLIIEVLEPCTERYAFHLTGEGYFPIQPKYTVTIWLPDTTGSIGAKNFTIPLRAKIKDKDTTFNNLAFAGEIRLNPQIFLPDSETIPSVVTIDGNGNNVRIISISGTANLNKSESIISEMTGDLYLEDKTSPLQITNFAFADTNIIAETIDGSLRVEGICIPAFSKLTYFTPTTMTIIPFPAQDRAEIRIQSGEEGTFTLSVYSITGELIERIIYENHIFPTSLRDFEKGGKGDFSLNLKEYPAGMYQVILQSPTGVVSGRLAVVK